MEPNSEQLAARIAATRDELSDNLDELGHRMKDAVNWRTQYQKHTALFLGAAVVGGVLLSHFVSSRSTRRDPRRSHPRAASLARTMQRSIPSAAENLWSDMKAAAGSALGSRVYSVLRDFVPRITQRAGEGLKARAHAGTRAGHDTDRRAGGTPSNSRKPAATAAPEGCD